MVRKGIQMYTLTTEQQDTLIEILNEEFGPQLGREEFADKLLGLFENIPGFETIPQKTADRFVNQIWRKYCGQKR